MTNSNLSLIAVTKITDGNLNLELVVGGEDDVGAIKVVIPLTLTEAFSLEVDLKITDFVIGFDGERQEG